MYERFLKVEVAIPGKYHYSVELTPKREPKLKIAYNFHLPKMLLFFHEDMNTVNEKGYNFGDVPSLMVPFDGKEMHIISWEITTEMPNESCIVELGVPCEIGKATLKEL